MKTAFKFSLLIFVLCGLVYPLVITGLGQWIFPHQANGSLIQDARRQVIGSELLGQSFSKPQYFQLRPSANGYDASNSGGSNYGATHKKLVDRTITDSNHYRDLNQTKKIPLDAVTASASGLDPHISLENALVQVSRISKARDLDEIALQKIVQLEAGAECDTIASISNACNIVNVLKLNLALDTLSQQGEPHDSL